MCDDIDMVPELMTSGFVCTDSFSEDDFLIGEDSTLSGDAITIGTPDLFDHELQIAPDNCAVEAERGIINQFLDEDLTQEDAMYISHSNGWYQPGSGTSMSDVGNMMDQFGIPNHSVDNATVADLASELKQGHAVIVGVDSQELWDSGVMADLKQWLSETFGLDFGDSGANHAVTVTGIDVSDPENPQVIINDSGDPNGDAKPYPMDKFLAAWEDSGFHYTATDVSLPDQCIMGDKSELSTLDCLVAAGSGFAGGLIGGYTGMEVFASTGNPIAAFEVGRDVTIGATNTLLDLYFGDDNNIVNL